MTESALSLALSVIALTFSIAASIIAVAASRGRRSALLLVREAIEELRMTRERMEELPPRVPHSHPSLGTSVEEARQQSEEAQLRELQELLEARQNSWLPGEEGPESAELAEQLKQLEHWLRTRGSEAQQDDD